MNPDNVTAPYSSLAGAIYVRVGRRGIADWLYLLGEHFGVPAAVMLPEKIEEEYSVVLSSGFLSLTLRHPHAVYDDIGDKQRWYLFNAVFHYPKDDLSGWILPTVLNLDVENTTPELLLIKYRELDITKLTHDDIARGYRRQSVFMDDARVVEISWREGMKGIERIVVTFVGLELDYITEDESGLIIS